MDCKKLAGIVFSTMLLMMGQNLLAQSAGRLGVGVVLGDPMGPTMKYWLSEKSAWDLTVGFQSDFSIHGDYLIHAWDIFPQPQKGKVGGYLGLGGKYQNRNEDDMFGLRMVGGINYFTPKHPLEIFLELAPVFEFTPDTDTSIDAGIGLRYYFQLK